MKIVHVMRKEKWTKGIVGFYNKFFNNGEHEVLYYNYEKDEILVDDKIDLKQYQYNENDKIDFIDYLKSIKCDYIVVHCLFFSDRVMRMLLFNKSLLDKIVWLEWGADLYSWKQGNGMKAFLKNYIRYKFRSSLKYVICIFPPDVIYLKNTFPNFKGRVFCAPYFTYPIGKEVLSYNPNSTLKDSIVNKKTIFIQIGQNAQSTLNHIDVIKVLGKFKNENIRLVIPLSYGGDKEYVKRVECYAREVFDDKAIILKEYLPKDEYFKIMDRIAIAIFNSKRQCALGNIHALNCRNVKLYIPKDSVMFDWFCDNGVPVNDYYNISNMSFDDFVRPSDIIKMEQFMHYIRSLSDLNRTEKMWRKIWDRLREDTN